jgi:hypothetical protein
MGVSEIRETKKVILFVEYDLIYDEEIDENLYIEREEVARSLKRIYFINDDMAEVEITKKLTAEQKEMILYSENQNGNA